MEPENVWENIVNPKKNEEIKESNTE